VIGHGVPGHGGVVDGSVLAGSVALGLGAVVVVDGTSVVLGLDGVGGAGVVVGEAVVGAVLEGGAVDGGGLDGAEGTTGSTVAAVGSRAPAVGSGRTARYSTRVATNAAANRTVERDGLPTGSSRTARRPRGGAHVGQGECFHRALPQRAGDVPLT
jgi:hypothetical protein